jgi:catechol 2,3-dioxygenase-like lactoylglutathione lyase family enzyme
MSENITQAVPFFGVREMAESLRFYVDGLGFRMKHQWVDDGRLRWCWLERGGAAMMLQEFWREGEHANVPATPVGVGMSICFTCADAIGLYHEFRGRGIEAGTPFVGNSMWVTELKDPDGYRLFFESRTDAPEDSVYNPAPL